MILEGAISVTFVLVLANFFLTSPYALNNNWKSSWGRDVTSVVVLFMGAALPCRNVLSAGRRLQPVSTCWRRRSGKCSKSDEAGRRRMPLAVSGAPAVTWRHTASYHNHVTPRQWHHMTSRHITQRNVQTNQSHAIAQSVLASRVSFTSQRE